MTSSQTRSISDLITLPENRLITFTGAGGKTSLIQWFAASAKAQPQRIIVTTTTKIFPLPGERIIFQDDGPDFLNRVRGGVTVSSAVVVAKRLDHTTGKLIGLDPDTISELHHANIADTILIEADGAARKPLKAPNATEPIIPLEADLCIGIMGLDAVYKPLIETNVHRHEIFSRVTQLAPGQPVTPHHMISLATAPNGLFKGCPPDCDLAVFLNKTDISGGLDLAKEFERALTSGNNTMHMEWFAGSAEKQQSRKIIYHPLAAQNLSTARYEFPHEL